MSKLINYLKQCGTFYLATSEHDQPHVRPFSTVCEFEDKVYFITNNQKKVYHQLLNNPKVELCGMHQGTWIRIEGKAIHDERRDAKVAMMEDNSVLLKQQGYAIDDDLMEVFYLFEANVTIYSFDKKPEEYKI